jgi:hypothetical protein
MMLNAAVEETKDLAEWVAESMRVAATNGKDLLSAKEDNMLVDYATTTDVAEQIREYFILHPDEELHLLGIVKHAHVSGNLNELRRIADALVAQGDLVVKSRHGARYYRLAPWR